MGAGDGGEEGVAAPTIITPGVTPTPMQVTIPGTAPVAPTPGAAGVPTQNDMDIMSPGYRGAEAFGTNRVTDTDTLGATPLVSVARVEQNARRLRDEYAELQNLYRVAVARRDFQTISNIRQRATAINTELRNVEGMRAIIQFNSGNVEPLANAFYDASNNTMQLEQRPDGTFNIYQNGQISSRGVTRDRIVAAGRALFDTEFQQQVRQARETAVRRANMAAEEAVKQSARAGAEIAIARARAAAERENPDIQVSSSTDANNRPILVYTDKRTGTVVGGALLVPRVPPGSPRGTEPVLTLEPIPVGSL
jgi:hypothetical protein